MENRDINIYIADRIKKFRTDKNLTQEEVAEYLDTTPQTVSRYENGIRKVDQDILFALAKLFKKSINDFFPSLNKEQSIENNYILIPVLGIIKAGVPIEAQENIIEYIDIPKVWLKGGKKYFGLKITGDSMSPKYLDGDIVIFEKQYDFISGNECAVLINNHDATFKKIIKNGEGIILQPLNPKYEIQYFTKEDIEKLPIVILGIAKEVRRKV